MHLRPHSLRRLAVSVAVSTLAAIGAGAATATPAQAATLGVFIDVTARGAATGTVSGIGTTYTAVLTASGGGTCSVANGPVTLADYDTGSGNPAITNTIGAVCSLYDATVEYTLTYTSVLGVTSTFYRTCVWVLGAQTCSVRGVNLA